MGTKRVVLYCEERMGRGRLFKYKKGRNVPLGTKRVQGESVIGSNIVEQRKLLARGRRQKGRNRLKVSPRVNCLELMCPFHATTFS